MSLPTSDAVSRLDATSKSEAANRTAMAAAAELAAAQDKEKAAVTVRHADMTLIETIPAANTH